MNKKNISKTYKRVLALLLAFVMMVGAFPATVLADEPALTATLSGDATINAASTDAEVEVVTEGTTSTETEIDSAILQVNVLSNSEMKPRHGTYTSDGPAQWAFDDEEHWWHSRYGGSAAEHEVDSNGNLISNGTVSSVAGGVWIQTGFDRTATITKLTYTSRGAGCGKEYTISYANLSDPKGTPKLEDFRTVDSVVIGSDGTTEYAQLQDTTNEQTIQLKEAVQATHIRITFTSTYDNSYVAAKKIKVFESVSDENTVLKSYDSSILFKLAKANSELETEVWGNGPATNAFDDDDTHWWHSNYSTVTDDNVNGNPSEANPIWIQTGFEKKWYVDSIIYVPKLTNGTTECNINNYTVSIANLENPTDTPDNEDFTIVAEGQLPNAAEVHKIPLDCTRAATHVRLTVTSVHGTNNYVVARKIMVYGYDSYPAANKEALQAAVEKYTEMYTGENAPVYPSEYKDGFTTALTEAQVVLNNVDAAQLDVDTALENLEEAVADMIAVIPLSAISEVTAGDYQDASEGADKAVDDNTTTKWHTDWNEGPNYDNHWLELKLDGIYLVDGFNYLPRQDGNTNGQITKSKIQVSIDGENWKTVANCDDWDTTKDWKKVTFAPTAAKYVRMQTVEATSDQSIKFTSAAEVRVLGEYYADEAIQLKVDEVYTEELVADTVVNTEATDVTVAEVTSGEITKCTSVVHDYNSNTPNDYSSSTPNENISPEDAEYTFTKVANGWNIKAGDMYFVNSGGGTFCSTSPRTMTVNTVKDENDNMKVQIYSPVSASDNRYLIYWTRSDKLQFDAVNKPSVNDISDATWKYNLTLLEKQETVSETDVIPGYAVATELEDGGKYIIAYVIDNDTVAILYPNVAQGTGATKIVEVEETVFNGLKVKGINEGVTTAVVNDTTYAIVVDINDDKLQKLIDMCDAMNSNVYTTASWTAFTEVLEAKRTALSEGTYTSQREVDAAVEELAAAKDALVPHVAVTSVTLDQTEVTLTNVGATTTLTATVAPDNATNKNLTWTSSDESVATVADGVVTAVAAGNATITVTTEDGSCTAACEVKVVEYLTLVVEDEPDDAGEVAVTLPDDKTKTTLELDNVVTVTATPAEGYEFAYWLDMSTEKVVSKTAEYTFRMVTNLNLKAVYTEKETTGYVIVFKTSEAFSNQIVATVTAVDGVVTLPEANNYWGYNFIGWDTDGDGDVDVNAEQETAEVTAGATWTAVYEAVATHTITVDGGSVISTSEAAGEDGSYLYGTIITIEPNAVVDGKEFKGWATDADGNNIVSTKETYEFALKSDRTLYAIWADEVETAKPIVAYAVQSRTTDASTGKQKVQLGITWEAPEEYTMISVGIIRTYSEDSKENLVLGTTDSAVKTHQHNTTAASGSYTGNVSIKAGSDNLENAIYTVGYIRYSDSNGAIHTVYTDVVEVLPPTN